MLTKEDIETIRAVMNEELAPVNEELASIKEQLAELAPIENELGNLKSELNDLKQDIGDIKEQLREMDTSACWQTGPTASQPSRRFPCQRTDIWKITTPPAMAEGILFILDTGRQTV